MHPVVANSGALVLGYVFVTAALHKWRNRAGFAGIVENYRLLPRVAVAPVASGLPLLEFVAGVAVLMPLLQRAAAVAAVLLLTGYAVAMAVNLRRGRTSIDCGCGDPKQVQPLSGWLLLRNAVLVVLALCVAFANGPSPAWYDWAIAVPVAVTGCLLYVIVNQLLANAAQLRGLHAHHG